MGSRRHNYPTADVSMLLTPPPPRSQFYQWQSSHSDRLRHVTQDAEAATQPASSLRSATSVARSTKRRFLHNTTTLEIFNCAWYNPLQLAKRSSTGDPRCIFHGRNRRIICLTSGILFFPRLMRSVLSAFRLLLSDAVFSHSRAGWPSPPLFLNPSLGSPRISGVLT